MKKALWPTDYGVTLAPKACGKADPSLEYGSIGQLSTALRN